MKERRIQFVCEKNCRICPSPGAICNRNSDSNINEEDSNGMVDLTKEKSIESKEGNV